MISTTLPQTPSLKEEVGENYLTCSILGDAQSVEEWINKEFGDTEESSSEIDHHETDLIYMAFTTQVDEYVDMVEFVDAAAAPLILHEGQAAFLFVPLDEGLFFEPDLWCFS